MVSASWPSIRMATRSYSGKFKRTVFATAWAVSISAHAPPGCSSRMALSKSR